MDDVHNPERIGRILAVLREAWMQVPDWRLGQLIFNALRPVEDGATLYRVPDERLEGRLTEMSSGILREIREAQEEYKRSKPDNLVDVSIFRFAPRDFWIFVCDEGGGNYRAVWKCEACKTQTACEGRFSKIYEAKNNAEANAADHVCENPNSD